MTTAPNHDQPAEKGIDNYVEAHASFKVMVEITGKEPIDWLTERINYLEEALQGNDTSCDSCDGTGTVNGKAHGAECKDCEGLGMVSMLTQFEDRYLIDDEPVGLGFDYEFEQETRDGEPVATLILHDQSGIPRNAALLLEEFFIEFDLHNAVASVLWVALEDQNGPDRAGGFIVTCGSTIAVTLADMLARQVERYQALQEKKKDKEKSSGCR